MLQATVQGDAGLMKDAPTGMARPQQQAGKELQPSCQVRLVVLIMRPYPLLGPQQQGRLPRVEARHAVKLRYGVRERIRIARLKRVRQILRRTPRQAC